MRVSSLLFVLVIAILSSCSGNLEKKIVKKWKVVSFGITPGAKVTDQDRMMIEGSKSLFSDVIYSLEEDGKFTLLVSGSPKASGKYEVNEKENTLLFGIQGMKEKYNITEITDSTLILRSTIKPVEMKFKAQ